MIRSPSHYGDDTCSSYVKAGDLIFLAHHGGGHHSDDVAVQMEESFKSLGRTLEAAGAKFEDIVQINLYLRDVKDFGAAREVFRRYFKSDQAPARMTTTTDFINPRCLCMLDGVAYNKA